MSEWIRWSNRARPDRRQLCDFLFNGDETEEKVWILCGALTRDLSDFDDPEFWRPAAPLPEGIGWRGDAERRQFEPLDGEGALPGFDLGMIEELHATSSDHMTASEHVGTCRICRLIEELRASIEAEG